MAYHSGGSIRFTGPDTLTVAEGQTAVGVFTVEHDTHAALTWSLIGGADADKFTIDAQTGALTLISLPDYEAPADAGQDNRYDLRIQVAADADTAVRNVSVSVTNVNEAPSFLTASNQAIAEHTREVCTLELTDPDAGDNLTVEIVPGLDAEYFNLTAHNLSFISFQILSNPQDSNADNIYDLRVSVQDDHGLAAELMLSVQVLDGADPQDVHIIGGLTHFYTGFGLHKQQVRFSLHPQDYVFCSMVLEW